MSQDRRGKAANTVFAQTPELVSTSDLRAARDQDLAAEILDMEVGEEVEFQDMDGELRARRIDRDEASVFLDEREDVDFDDDAPSKFSLFDEDDRF